MEAFVQPLRGLAEYEEISSRIGRNPGLVQIAGCVESQKAHLICGLSGLFPCRLILAQDESRAKELYEDYRSTTRRCFTILRRTCCFFRPIFMAIC